MTVEEYALKINIEPEKLLNILKNSNINITELNDILDNNLISQLNSFFSSSSTLDSNQHNNGGGGGSSGGGKKRSDGKGDGKSGSGINIDDDNTTQTTSEETAETTSEETTETTSEETTETTSEETTETTSEETAETTSEETTETTSEETAETTSEETSSMTEKSLEDGTTSDDDNMTDDNMTDDSGVNLDPVKIANAYKCLTKLDDILSDVNYGMLDDTCNKKFYIDGNPLCNTTNYLENGARMKGLSSSAKQALSNTLDLLNIDITFDDLTSASEEEKPSEKTTLLDGDTISNDGAIDDRRSKPSSHSSFASQGLVEAGDYTFISSYDTNKEEKSRIDVVDGAGNYKTVNLDTSSHVGGLGYHDESGKLYVCDGKDVSVYDMSDVAEAEHQGAISKTDQFSIEDTTGTASYMTVNGDSLYVGKFVDRNNSNMPLSKYNLDANGNPIYEGTYEVPYGKIQGLTVHNVGDQEYFIFAQSFGRKNESNIIVSTLENGEFKTVKTIGAPPMLEQISVNENGQLGMVFESDSTHYKGASEVVDEVLYVDLEKII